MPTASADGARATPSGQPAAVPGPPGDSRTGGPATGPGRPGRGPGRQADRGERPPCRGKHGAGNTAGARRRNIGSGAGRSGAGGVVHPGSRGWRTRWRWRHRRPTGSPRRPWIRPASAPSWPATSVRCGRAAPSLRPRVLGAGRDGRRGHADHDRFQPAHHRPGRGGAALQIWSSKPVTGAWYWVTSRSVRFRPRHYWPAHTRVRFTAHLAGLQGAPGSTGGPTWPSTSGSVTR